MVTLKLRDEKRKNGFRTLNVDTAWEGRGLAIHPATYGYKIGSSDSDWTITHTQSGLAAVTNIRLKPADAVRFAGEVETLWDWDRPEEAILADPTLATAKNRISKLRAKYDARAEKRALRSLRRIEKILSQAAALTDEIVLPRTVETEMRDLRGVLFRLRNSLVPVEEVVDDAA